MSSDCGFLVNFLQEHLLQGPNRSIEGSIVVSAIWMVVASSVFDSAMIVVMVSSNREKGVVNNPIKWLRRVKKLNLAKLDSKTQTHSNSCRKP
jgi:hypothetical protein